MTEDKNEGTIVVECTHSFRDKETSPPWHSLVSWVVNRPIGIEQDREKKSGIKHLPLQTPVERQEEIPIS